MNQSDKLRDCTHDKNRGKLTNILGIEESKTFIFHNMIIQHHKQLSS